MVKLKILILIIFAAAFFNVSNAQGTNKSFRLLDKLLGSWKMNNSKGFIIEQWEKNSDGSLSSKSFLVKNETDTTLLEEVNLIKTNSGIFYIPVVMDQNNRQPISFKLIERKKFRFVFENLEHDYPQRIIYHFINSTTLDARIEGLKNGISKSSDFHYKKEN